MSKISLDRITSQFGFQAAFNAILQRIEDEFSEKVLYRDNPAGSVNTMVNDLDMGEKDILNVGLVSAKDFRVDGVDITQSLSDALEEVAAYPAEAQGYRDEALAARDAAQTSASEASTSASQAASSASDAYTSASQASSSALASATSATESATSASEAAARVADVEVAVDAATADALLELEAALEQYKIDALDIIKNYGVPVGAEFPWFADPNDVTGGVPPGYVLALGEELSRATYPDLWGFVASTGRVVSEATWQSQYASNSGNVGFYSDGNGSTTFRVPRIMRYVSGGEIAEAGTYLGDATRNITGSITNFVQNNATQQNGVLRSQVQSTQTTSIGAGTNNAWTTLSIDASRQVPTADENRPKTIKRTYIIKAFSAAVNTGAVDVPALASEVAAINAAIQAPGRVVGSERYTTTATFLSVTADMIGNSGAVLPTEGLEVATLAYTTRASGSKLLVTFTAFIEAISGGTSVNGSIVDNGVVVVAERVANVQVQAVLRAVIDGGVAGTLHNLSVRLGRNSNTSSFSVGNFATPIFGTNQHQIVLTVEEFHG